MRKLYSFLIFFVSLFHSLLAEEIYVNDLIDQNITLSSGTDYHITASSQALVNSTVNITDENSRLFFDNIIPSEVIDNYQTSILINGTALSSNVNSRITRYINGTVIIPHPADYTPLEVFSEQNFTGSSQRFGIETFYNNLGIMDNNIRSFRLKRGYSVTFANNDNGTGYSRVFVADESDLSFSILPDILDETISFIRVFKWDYNSKKGWCGSNPSEADQVNATWYYSWSADKESTPNYQFVPIKQNLGWPGFDEINSKTKVSHLLGYNEPDRPDQSNMSVEQAIEQWADLLKTGLRLGSPVPSNPGNGNGWLYKFLDKCDSLNYRVDYVVVHAYWGNKSPKNWYNDLKKEYEKCGKRPLWITEWNNGANWTGENWPSGDEAQKQKQLTELKAILNVLDTCSFVERYSIYDWVNWGNVNGTDKQIIRAMIWNGELTPAGEYYRNNKSAIAFKSKNEVTPTWNMLPVKLSYALDNKNVKLQWQNPNEGLTERYIVERSINKASFDSIGNVDSGLDYYMDSSLEEIRGTVDYRVVLVAKDGQYYQTNVVKHNVSFGGPLFQYGKSTFSNTDLSYYCYNTSYAEAPIVIFGPTSNSNASIPFTQRVRSISTNSFMFQLKTWEYLGSPVFKEEDIAYLTLPTGTHDLNGIKVQANSVKNVGRNWVSVTFPTAFDVIPAVFVTQASTRNTTATALRIRNVTNKGFEVLIQKELAQRDINPTVSVEIVNYVALTPGTGSVNGKKIRVGLTDESAVGTIHSPSLVNFGETLEDPLFFAYMQTTSDTIVSTLRYTQLTNTGVKIFRQRELSKGGSPTFGEKEQAAWMVIDLESERTSVDDVKAASQFSLFPNPVFDVLHINSENEKLASVEIYSLSGQKRLDEQYEKNIYKADINVSPLDKGIYFVRINTREVFKIIKR